MNLPVQKKRKLTEQQQRFCIEYQKDGNATQSAIRAGYSKKTAGQTGSYLLNHPVVAARLQAKTQERLEAAQVDRDYLVALTKDVTEKCRKEETWDAGNALRGAEILGKFIDIAGEAGSQTQQVQVNVNMSADEVTRIYTEYMGR